MKLTNQEVIKESVIQSAFEYVDNILQDYQKLQPEFKYTLNFATNLNQEFVEDNDTFNIVMFTGSVDKVPTHYIEHEGITQLIYAGYFEIALSIVNPIPLLYLDGDKIITLKQPELSDNLYDQDIENNYYDYEIELENNNKKIEYATRLLEGLSLFFTRKGVKINGFNFSTRADVPIPDGQFEIGFYRLTETLPISVKFNQLNEIGKAIRNGENYRLWIKTKSNNNNTEYTEWTEFYSLFECYINNNAVDKSFALFNEATMKNINNQLSRTLSISCLELTIGAVELLKELAYSGNLEALEDIQFRMFDGDSFYTFEGVWNFDERPANVDQFNGFTAMFNITSDIEKVI
jgi:hypothetical protein